MVTAQGATPESVGFLVGIGVFYVAILAVVVWAYVAIVRRAGYSGWWVLIGLVPIANLVMFFVFAFKQSPAQRELAALRSLAAQMGHPIHPDGVHGVGPGAPWAQPPAYPPAGATPPGHETHPS